MLYVCYRCQRHRREKLSLTIACKVQFVHVIGVLDQCNTLITWSLPDLSPYKGDVEEVVDTGHIWSPTPRCR
jgi:hypothetical protein